jgi:hypothetical protein
MSGEDAKFSAERPKGSKWGVTDAIRRAAEEFQRTGHATPFPCIAFLSVKAVTLKPGESDEPIVEVTVKVAAIESLDTPDGRRKAHLLVLKESQKRLGSGDNPTLPFELKQMFDEAFGGRSFDEIERDEREAAMDADMDDPTRLRHHLHAVHGHDLDKVLAMEWADVRGLHDSDHDRPETDGVPPHNREWWAWRRVDLDAAESEADGMPPDEGTADDAADDNADEPAPLFHDGTEGEGEG